MIPTFARVVPVLAAGLLCFAQAPRLSVLGTYRTGAYNAGAAEIVAHDPASQRLFVVNAAGPSIDILDMRNPADLKLISRIRFTTEVGRAANSVSVKDGIVAVAVEAAVKTDPGTCAFYETDGTFITSVKVGALPDMLTFTPDGKKVLVANEAEPSDDYTVDPEGSVSIIDLSKGVRNLTQADVTTAGFGGFTRASLEPGVRIFGRNATVAQDLEPEYITISPDSKTAYVTLQENNAIGILDIDSGRFTRIAALGMKEFWRRGNELDPSDRDGGPNINVWPIYGLFMPDAIASYTGPDGQLYLITANEGDAREWGTFIEPARLSTVRLDPSVPGGAALQAPEALGRLNITTASGDLDGDGDFDEIHVFGGRSITVWSARVEQLWDSHNQFEVFLRAEKPEAFNVSNTDNTVDSRSDDKGPEPEAVTVGTVRGKNYAFVGNERTSNIMVYDLTVPDAPVYTGMFFNRNYSVATNTAEAGDLGPEGMIFVREQDSPTGKPLLIVANEISGTTTVWQID
jgi:2',3'-cyclic-nucleotide 2'-phosphodiesterase / 3'-nucleotidase / 5'-nucleotidase